MMRLLPIRRKPYGNRADRKRESARWWRRNIKRAIRTDGNHRPPRGEL